MSYIPLIPKGTPSGRVVDGVGHKDAKVVLIGEALGEVEERVGRPFAGPAGSVLEQCLHTSGLTRAEVYITNVVKVRPKNNKIDPYFNSKTGKFTAEGWVWVHKLWEELDDLSPNILIPLGAPSLAAVTAERLSRINKYRGYIFESEGPKKTRKVLSTIHPAATFKARGNYIYRHIISGDLKKAKLQSQFPEIIRPERELVYNFSTVDEVLEWLRYYEEQEVVCFDIEVINFETSCISFSSDPKLAISVPIHRTWTEEEELRIWLAIQKVLGNPKSVKIAHNAIFDCHFLLTRNGIVVRGPIHDTLIAHHIIYSDLPKPLKPRSLAFLGSVYCGAQRYWKDTVKFENIKEEA